MGPPHTALSTSADAPTSSDLATQIQSIIAEQLQQMMISSGSGSSASQSSATLPAIAPFSLKGNKAIPRIFDSGASSHMTSDASLLTHTYSPSFPHFIYTTDSSQLPVAKIGSITTGLLSISIVLFVPNLSMNLFSVSLPKMDISLHFPPLDVLYRIHQQVARLG